MARKGGLSGLSSKFTSGSFYPNKREFVLGSKPPDLFSPRIKPVDPSQRQYGKSGDPQRQPNFSGGIQSTKGVTD